MHSDLALFLARPLLDNSDKCMEVQAKLAVQFSKRHNSHEFVAATEFGSEPKLNH